MGGMPLGGRLHSRPLTATPQTDGKHGGRWAQFYTLGDLEGHCRKNPLGEKSGSPCRSGREAAV